MPQERRFRAKMLPWAPKGKKWVVEERILNELSRFEWEIIAKHIPSEPKANEIIDIYKR